MNVVSITYYSTEGTARAARKRDVSRARRNRSFANRDKHRSGPDLSWGHLISQQLPSLLRWLYTWSQRVASYLIACWWILTPLLGPRKVRLQGFIKITHWRRPMFEGEVVNINQPINQPINSLCRLTHEETRDPHLVLSNAVLGAVWSESLHVCLGQSLVICCLVCDKHCEMVRSQVRSSGI